MKTPKPMYSPSEIEFFWTYAKHPDFNVKISILNYNNSSVPIEILEYLANDQDWYVRMLVALYKGTPIELLRHLIFDRNPSVRCAALRNSNCTEEIKILSWAHRKYGHLMNRHTQSLKGSDFMV